MPPTPAINADLEARIALQALQIELLKRDRFGQRLERSQRLIDQLELTFAEAEAAASEDEAAAAIAAAKTTTVTAFVRNRPTRQPLPAHLPRTRVVIPSPACCAGCGSDRLSKLGEDITETLEVIPRQWKVIQTVRERFAWPRLREHQPTAGALLRHTARHVRVIAAGDDAVREVRAAPAPEPPARPLRL